MDIGIGTWDKVKYMLYLYNEFVIKTKVNLL